MSSESITALHGYELPLFPPTAASFRPRREDEGRLDVVGQHEVAHFLELLLAPLDRFFHANFLIGGELQLRLGLRRFAGLLPQLCQSERSCQSRGRGTSGKLSAVNLGHRNPPCSSCAVDDLRGGGYRNWARTATVRVRRGEVFERGSKRMTFQVVQLGKLFSGGGGEFSESEVGGAQKNLE